MVAIHFADGGCNNLVNCQIEMYMCCVNTIPNCMHRDVFTQQSLLKRTSQHNHKPLIKVMVKDATSATTCQI